MDGVADYHPACAQALRGLAEGLAAGCGRHLAVNLTLPAGGAAPLVWHIG